MARRIALAPADEAAVRQLASVIGPCSAADRALAELDMRRRAGEAVSIYQSQSFWVVGPQAQVDEMRE